MAPFLNADDVVPVDFPRVTKATVLDAPVQPDKNGQEDVAVVGMACRVAGGNNSPEELWESILSKQVASGEIPALRWEPYLRRDVRNPKILKDTTQRGYFLDNLENFDSTFFGISPKEAVLMDPQQRVTMEVTWEALEDAGISPQGLAGSNTAVFMGVNSDDYAKLLLEDLPGVEAWMGIGTAYCGVPNRISYLLDLRGPSTAVDAACASSLVAIHHGRQALLQKESDVAIVGGVNALCGPGLTRVLDKAGAISKDGTCRSFDQDAAGYGRGEGAAVIVLKRMSDAVRGKDRILAVLKGSAVGQDGRTNGIMAPNGIAQQAVARTALGDVDPTTIQYVEAHATSTPVGDPVEIDAMAKVYGGNRKADAPCYVGSVKANVGHLEAGAGAVGFIKAIMSLRNGTVPPQANVTNLRRLDWDGMGIKVPLEKTTWPQVPHARRAAICSYGYGGTVSHAVIEATPEAASFAPTTVDADEPRALLLTAPQEKRLPGDAATLGRWLAEAGKEQSLASVAATLATRRGHHDNRVAFVVDGHEEAVEATEKFAAGAASEHVVTGRVLGKKDEGNGAVWMFSGHGAQWPAMGEELLVKEPLFRQTIEDLEPIIQAEAGFSALQALKTGDFAASDKVQVLTYAIQIGLAALLRSKGAEPSAIIGHSVGEIAASVAAGALTAGEGAIVVCRRAALYRQVMGTGAMILVNVPFAEAADVLAGRCDVTASIDSSPSSCVVSGSVAAIKEMTGVWESLGVKVLKVKTDIAFHSPLLNCLAKPLHQALDDVLDPMEPLVPLYSTASQDARDQAARDATYWVGNMLQPVLLTNAVRTATDDGHRVFLEVSSHPVITHSVNETLMDMDVEDFAVIPTLLRNKPARKALLKGLANLWSKGVSVDWNMPFDGVQWADSVPKTAWKHQAFWKGIGTGSTATSVVHDVDSHTLLGQRLPVAGDTTTVFSTKLDDDTKPFPGSHPLHGTEIIPAAVLFNTFFHATGARQLSDVSLRVPVAISAPRDIQILTQPGDVRLMSRLVQSNDEAGVDHSWLTHTTATVGSKVDDEETAPYGVDVDPAATRARIGTELSKTFSIDYLASVGVPDMGFPWAVTDHVGNNKEMLARVDVSPATTDGASPPWSATSWAPIFDAATSIGSTLFFDVPRLRMPAHVDGLTIRDGAVPPKIGYIHVQEATVNNSNLAVDVTVTDEAGRALAKFTGMRFSEIEGTPGAKESADGLVHQLAWPPAQLSEKPLPFTRAVLVGDEESVMMKEYKKQLAKRCLATTSIGSAELLSATSFDNDSDGTVVMYLGPEAESIEAVPAAANDACKELLDIVKFVAKNGVNARVYAVTDGALAGATPTALAHAPLVGLGRIIAAEQSGLWGALIDVESTAFPYQVVKYIAGADVVRVEDSIARVSRLRPMPQDKMHPADQVSKLHPRPEGTYIISGGLGSLGLEVAGFLVERGARRIVLLSRRALPPRRTWSSATGTVLEATQKIQLLEQAGATVYSLAVDLSVADAADVLARKLDDLSLPRVLGVVHAAGVLEDQLVLETTAESFNRVLAPKVAGTLALDKAFPVGSLDFLMLFSSCGQLFGFPGQASYASGNAFLDSVAERRRSQGDNTIAFQWTSWRGMGMAASTDFIEAELESKGITSVSRDEAFRAWDHAAKYDTSHAVVLRARVLDADEMLPMDILADIAQRRSSANSTEDGSASSSSPSSGAKDVQVPAAGPERNAFLTTKISECVATVLDLADANDVDSRVALPELGMDSVMTVALRKQLQQTLKVKVPPTLVWGHPTVGHLVKWFADKV